LAADAIADHGLVLAELTEQTRAALGQIVPAYGSIDNPVDVTAAVMREPSLVERSLRVLASDPQVDMLVVGFCVLTGEDVSMIVNALADVAAATGKPVLVARTGAEHLAPQAGSGLRAAGVPGYPTPARAVRAAAALWQVSRPRPAATPAAAARVDQGIGSATRRQDTNEPLDQHAGVARQPGEVASPPGTEDGLKQLLAEAGVRTPKGIVASSPAQAQDAARELGNPVVMKALGLLHKTEAGGVALGVTSESAGATWRRLAAVSQPSGQVLVEEQVTGGVEVLVGVTPSPLGAVLALGAGGVLTEVLDDVAVRLLPVTELDLREMLSHTKVSRLLAGHRGAPPADVAALIELICRVQDLVAGWPAGYSLDLNPVTVLPDGAVVLDAVCQFPGARAQHEGGADD
ncbi:MAG: acetate--CoA ligase family protein, partial [Micromonosporaceae bacterium]